MVNRYKNRSSDIINAIYPIDNNRKYNLSSNYIINKIEKLSLYFHYKTSIFNGTIKQLRVIAITYQLPYYVDSKNQKLSTKNNIVLQTSTDKRK